MHARLDLGWLCSFPPRLSRRRGVAARSSDAGSTCQVDVYAASSPPSLYNRAYLTQYGDLSGANPKRALQDAVSAIRGLPACFR